MYKNILLIKWTPLSITYYYIHRIHGGNLLIKQNVRYLMIVL